MAVHLIPAQALAQAEPRPYSTCCTKLCQQIAKICTAVKNFFRTCFEGFKRGFHNIVFRLDAFFGNSSFDRIQKEREELTRQGVAQLAQGFFFEIRDAQNQVKGHLLGVRHVMDAEMFGWQPRILEALRNSTDLALENDLRNYKLFEQRDELIEQAQQEFFNDPNLDRNAVHQSVQAYKQVMINLGWATAREVANIETKAARAGDWKAQVKNEFKSLNQIASKKCSSGMNDTLNVEDRVLFKAHRLGKRIIGLEGPQSLQHIKSMESAGIRSSLIAVDARELQQKFQDAPRQWQDLKRAWMQGSLNTFRDFLLANEESDRPQRERDPVLEQLHNEELRILDARNREQAEKIDHYTRQGRRLFVQVGAAHLIDYANMTGVITRLQNMGWQVVQVPEVPLQAAAGA